MYNTKLESKYSQQAVVKAKAMNYGHRHVKQSKFRFLGRNFGPMKKWNSLQIVKHGQHVLTNYHVKPGSGNPVMTSFPVNGAPGSFRNTASAGKDQPKIVNYS
jgi:hypothetical protein